MKQGDHEKYRKESSTRYRRKSAGVEYAGRGIRINGVSPGLFHTAMADQMIACGKKRAPDAMLTQVPVGRLGRPEEIAGTVLFLFSDAASLIIGHTQRGCGWRSYYLI